MTTEEKMEVMKAFIEGKPIQCKRVDYNDDWYDCNPAWDWPTFEYRVKPEATESSFSIDDVIKALTERCEKTSWKPFDSCIVEYLKSFKELKEKVKTLRAERVQMANSVSSAVWKELMNRAEDIDGPVNTRMAGFGFNDISDLVLNKILEYKPEDNKILEYKPEDKPVKRLRRMTYKELDDWLKQGKGVIRIANHVRNEISYDCEDRNHEVSGYYKICGYDEDTWHEPMIEE